MSDKDLLVHFYDMIAQNTEYKPREGIDYILANEVEDYCLDYAKGESPAIMFYCKDDRKYRLTLSKIEED